MSAGGRGPRVPGRPLIKGVLHMKHIMDRIFSIRDSLRTQDQLDTVQPMYCVRGTRRIYGMDPRWTDCTVWVDTEDGCEEVEAPEDGDETDTIQETGYKDVVVTLMSCLTRAGCEEHLRLNGHNYRHYGDVHIYVESFYRCPEMIAVREFLLGLEKDGEGFKYVPPAVEL